MFPSLSICENTLKIIRDKIQLHAANIDFFDFKIGHIVEFLKFIWEHNYIKVNGKTYQQTSGISTGGHSSQGVADIIIDHMYCTTNEKIEIEPNALSLYVDDSFGIWTQGEERYNLLLDTLYEIWPTV